MLKHAACGDNVSGVYDDFSDAVSACDYDMGCYGVVDEYNSEGFMLCLTYEYAKNNEDDFVYRKPDVCLWHDCSGNSDYFMIFHVSIKESFGELFILNNLLKKKFIFLLPFLCGLTFKKF